jgi:ATP-dependent Clp protease ATP-binding subunit ClpC
LSSTTTIETIEILQGIKEPYQEHHSVEITDEAIEAAANLSARYVPDRFLPDKAIDLIDEAAARLRMYKSPEAAQVRRADLELQEVENELNILEEENGDEAQITRLRHQREDLLDMLESFRSNWNEETHRPRLTAEDIAEVVSMWTGIPVMRIAGEESERLIHMEEALHARIVGQEEAIAPMKVAPRAAGLKDRAAHRPQSG